ncbi:MAG: type II secretion system protein [Candidatus Aminicenantes bacterium]|nr:type II secretion system protein [Candidatus Aminicenantes bacterium]
MENKKRLNGFTLIELLIVVFIIAILAVVAVPLVETTVKREREIQLRRNLRIIVTAIDEYKKFVVKNQIEHDEDTYGYPESLEELVKGVEYEDQQGEDRVQKFLRKIPVDPMTSTYEWGMRSYQDKHDTTSWGGENVWDVYTTSERKALDGTYYKDW